MDLSQLEALAADLTRSQEALKQAIIKAVQTGTPKQAVCDTTGVARTTINRWVAEAESSP